MDAVISISTTLLIDVNVERFFSHQNYCKGGPSLGIAKVVKIIFSSFVLYNVISNVSPLHIMLTLRHQPEGRAVAPWRHGHCLKLCHCPDLATDTLRFPSAICFDSRWSRATCRAWFAVGFDKPRALTKTSLSGWHRLPATFILCKPLYTVLLLSCFTQRWPVDPLIKFVGHLVPAEQCLLVHVLITSDWCHHYLNHAFWPFLFRKINPQIL